MTAAKHLIMTCIVGASLAGCNANPDVAPVRGVVLMDGKPLPGGRIMFEPIAQGDNKLVGKTAFGQIQSDGTFVLTTFEENDGALIGLHHPVVFGERVDDDDAGGRRRQAGGGPNIGVVRMTDTTLEVMPGVENEFEITMKSRSNIVRGAVEDD